jgi:hypothetical protein
MSSVHGTQLQLRGQHEEALKSKRGRQNPRPCRASRPSGETAHAAGKQLAYARHLSNPGTLAMDKPWDDGDYMNNRFVLCCSVLSLVLCSLHVKACSGLHDPGAVAVVSNTTPNLQTRSGYECAVGADSAGSREFQTYRPYNVLRHAHRDRYPVLGQGGTIAGAAHYG